MSLIVLSLAYLAIGTQLASFYKHVSLINGNDCPDSIYVLSLTWPITWLFMVREFRSSGYADYQVNACGYSLMCSVMSGAELRQMQGLGKIVIRNRLGIFECGYGPYIHTYLSEYDLARGIKHNELCLQFKDPLPIGDSVAMRVAMLKACPEVVLEKANIKNFRTGVWERLNWPDPSPAVKSLQDIFSPGDSGNFAIVANLLVNRLDPHGVSITDNDRGIQQVVEETSRRMEREAPWSP